MKPRALDYVRPESVEEAVSLLAEQPGEARILAGGQSLMAMMNLRLVSPETLIDISQMPALRGIREDRGHIVIGAAVTQAEVLAWPGLSTALPFIATALPWVGHFQTRNRGTVCGSIAHSDPSSELPLAFALLGGEVCLRSAKGERWLNAKAFQIGLLQTARRDDEMITAVRFPKAVAGTRVQFREIARRHGDFALLGIGICHDPSGTIRLGIGGMTDTAHVTDLPRDLNGTAMQDWVNAKAWELYGLDDLHATARYRRDLLRRLLPAMLNEVEPCTV